jgi:uncharacterized protein
MTLLNIDHPFAKLKFRYLALRFILISILVVLTFKIIQASSILKLNRTDLVLIAYTIESVLLCFWLLKNFKRLRIKLKHVIGDLPKNQNWLRLAGLVPLVLMFSIGVSLILSSLLSSELPYELERLLSNGANNSFANSYNFFKSNLLDILTACVVAPITEEFIFRGVILQRFSTKWGIRAGLLLSSLLFGCFHSNFIGLSLFGIILGVFYIKTRSLIVPIAFHALNNILATLMPLLPNNLLSYIPIEQLRSSYLYLWIGIVLVAISLPLLLCFLSRNWPSKGTVIPYLSNAHVKYM